MFEEFFDPLLNVISFIISLIALLMVLLLRKRVSNFHSEVESRKEKIKNGQNEEDIEWLKFLKKRLKESVGRFSEDLDEENWRELEARIAYLRRFRSALEEIKSAMSQDDRASFAVYVDREVEKPAKTNTGFIDATRNAK